MAYVDYQSTDNNDQVANYKGISVYYLVITGQNLTIITGGATGRPANNAATANFAIAFNNTDYIIIPVGVIDASDSKFSLTVNVLKDYKTANSCTFRTSDAIAPACYYVAFSRQN